MRFIDPFFVKKDSSVPRPHMKRQNSLRKFIFAKILYSRKTCVGVVVDYADTMANFDGLRLTLKEQIKVFGCVSLHNSNILKIWKGGQGLPSVRLKLHVPIVVNYADTYILNFAIKTPFFGRLRPWHPPWSPTHCVRPCWQQDWFKFNIHTTV